MARLKITGYIDTAELDDSHVDLDHPSGLSSEGYDDLVTGESGSALALTDLEDVEVEKEDN